MGDWFQHNFHIPLTPDERREMWNEINARIARKQAQQNNVDPLKSMGYSGDETSSARNDKPNNQF